MRALFPVLVLSLLACRESETDPSEIDLDGDGATADVDCDDADPEVTLGPTWHADADGDGYGDPDVSVQACEAPLGYVLDGGDCDDTSARFHPGAPEEDCTDPSDYNCDGSVGWADDDGDGWAACEECDDGEAAVNPDADETCNETDDDCDGEVDEDAVDAPTWYLDADGDGYGTPRFTERDCEAPEGYVADGTDCDDLHAGSWPGGTERCDEHDNDCDGTVDEDDAVDAPDWYADADGDGYGDADAATAACLAPEGTVDDATDCDDADPEVSPDATEVCNEVDDDCDGTVDEPDAADATTWYSDIDGDGYGGGRFTTTACEAPSGYVDDTDDCDDLDADAYPGADETCDGADNDCDGNTDEEDAIDPSTWYADADGDGYGDPDTSQDACDAPSGYVANDDDCDDAVASTNPTAYERCDGSDNDCDGDTDEDDAIDADTWYLDDDGDGYGTASTSEDACEAPSGYVDNDDDCDDADSSVSPSATEYCDEIDNDCDGDTDEGDAADADTFWADDDGDGYGDADASTTACEQPSGYVDDDSDCHDTDSTAYPGSHETETPGDGIDTDCDGEDACSDLDCDGYPDLVATSHYDGNYYSTSYFLYSSGAAFSTSDADAIIMYGTNHHAIHDIDQDGYQDVVVAVQCYSSGTSCTRSGYSPVYWGSSSGYSSSDRDDLPTVGAMPVCVADFDDDGYEDIFFGSYYTGSSHNTTSYVYWGSSSGWSSSDRTSLTTYGARWCSADDVDADGYPDLVVSNYRSQSSYSTNSYVYWGSSSGLSTSDRTALPTHGSHHHVVEDLDGDGYEDVVFANYYDGSYSTSSYVYWGSSSGWSSSDRTSLTTYGAHHVSAADLDGDGYHDLVFSNHYSGSTYNTNSYVYWGSSSGYSSSDRTSLPTWGTTWNEVADLDGDGYDDIVFANYRHQTDRNRTSSMIYWGSSSGYSSSDRTELPTVGALSLDIADFDDDGYDDLAFGGYHDNSWSSAATTYVYWSSAGSFSTSDSDSMTMWGIWRISASD